MDDAVSEGRETVKSPDVSEELIMDYVLPELGDNLVQSIALAVAEWCNEGSVEGRCKTAQ